MASATPQGRIVRKLPSRQSRESICHPPENKLGGWRRVGGFLAGRGDFWDLKLLCLYANDPNRLAASRRICRSQVRLAGRASRVARRLRFFANNRCSLIPAHRHARAIAFGNRAHTREEDGCSIQGSMKPKRSAGQACGIHTTQHNTTQHNTLIARGWKPADVLLVRHNSLSLSGPTA